MSRSNNNKGGNSVFADNSDRTFKTLLANRLSESTKHSTGSGKGANGQTITAKQILVKIFQETAQTGVNILQKLTGQSNR